MNKPELEYINIPDLTRLVDYADADLLNELINRAERRLIAIKNLAAVLLGVMDD